MAERPPSHAADRLRGRALPDDALVVTRLGRRVYIGIVGAGYVRLRPRAARAFGAEVCRLAGLAEP